MALTVLLSPIGFGALSDDCGGKVTVEAKCECRITHSQRLDVYESATMGSDSMWCFRITHPTWFR